MLHGLQRNPWCVIQQLQSLFTWKRAFQIAIATNRPLHASRLEDWLSFLGRVLNYIIPSWKQHTGQLSVNHDYIAAWKLIISPYPESSPSISQLCVASLVSNYI